MHRESEISHPYHLDDNTSPLSPNNPYLPNLFLYLPSLNRFVDTDWKVVHDMSDLFSVWELQIWKRNKEDAILTDADGVEYCLYFLTGPEEEEVLDYMHWSELHYNKPMDKDKPDIIGGDPYEIYRR